MTYEHAVSVVAKHNYKQNSYTMRVIPTTLFFAGIPLIVAAFIIKEDVIKERFTTLEEAAEHGEKIMQNILSET